MIQYISIALILVGIYGLLSQKNVIKLIVSLNIFEIGLNIFIISIGFVKDGIAPIISSSNASSAMYVDPLPHALVLTAIVIGVGVTALKYRTLNPAAVSTPIVSSMNESDDGRASRPIARLISSGMQNTRMITRNL